MLDWTFITHYAPFFVTGSEMTLFISVFGIALAIAVGLVCAGVEIARIPVLRQIVRVYIELSRNTPLLVLADVMYMAKDLIGMYYSTYESLFMLVVAYLIILLPISLFGTWLERRFDYERR